MKFLELNSGTSVPQLGLGTSQSSDAGASVESGLQTGYRHVDTAQMYQNEAAVGKGLRNSGVPREEVFLTTKLHNPHHAPEDVHRTFAESLQRLDVDYVDLFLIHWPMPHDATDYVETWRTMIELRDSGQAKAIGVSNFTQDHLRRIIDATGVTPAMNQIEVHPTFANNALRQFCREHGIVVTAWSPLGKGEELERPEVLTIAERLERSPAQVILRWHLQRGDVVIPKSDDPQRQQSNFDVFDFELDTEDMAALDALDRGEDGRRSPHPDDFGKD